MDYKKVSIIASIWLVAMVLLWVFMGITGDIILFWAALDVTLSGPILGISVKLKKFLSLRVKLILGIWLILMIDLWVAFGVALGVSGVNLILFIVALTVTISWGVAFIVGAILIGKKSEKSPNPLRSLGWLGFLGFLSYIDPTLNALAYLWFFLFGFLLGVIPYKSKEPRRINPLGYLGFLGLLGLVGFLDPNWLNPAGMSMFFLTSLTSLAVLGALPKKAK